MPTRLILVLVSLSATPLFAAEEPPKLSESEIRELRVLDMVDMVALLGRGEVGAAVDKIQLLTGRKFGMVKTKNGVVNERDKWMKVYSRFKTIKLKFESAEVVAVEAISSNVKNVSMIAVGIRGPLLIQFRLFKFAGRYRLGNVSFSSDWKVIEAQVAAFKNRVSNVYDLKKFGMKKQLADAR